MKKKNKLLFYIFSMTFCCLFMLFFSSNQIKALDNSAFESSCIDRDNGLACSKNTTDAYFILERINIGNEEITNLTIPDTVSLEFQVEGSSPVVVTGNIEIIGNGSESVIDSSNKLMLTEIVLPTNVIKINNNSFHNITSVGSLQIPLSLQEFGANIFEVDTVVEKMYLNHKNIDIPNEDRQVKVDDNSFNGVKFTQIFCGSHTICEYYLSTSLRNENLVVKITYNFYKYQNPSYVNNEILGGSGIEYSAGINERISTLPDPVDLTQRGLSFVGWCFGGWCADGEELKVGSKVEYTLNTSSYNIYPKYELIPLTFNIKSENDVYVARYSGNNELINLKIYGLTLPTGYTKTIKWFKVFGDVQRVELKNFEDSEVANFAYVADTGDYNCEITYTYPSNLTIDGSSYSRTITTQNPASITINTTPLYVTIDDLVKVNDQTDYSKTYGYQLSDADIKYNVKGLLKYTNNGSDNEDIINHFAYDYPTGMQNAGKYYNVLKIKNIEITDKNNNNRTSNYDIVYSYGDYTVNKKIIDVSYDETFFITYGSPIEVSKDFYDDELAKTVKVVFAKENGSDANTEAKTYYDIIGVKKVLNSNYDVNYVDDADGKVVITSKRVDTKIAIDSSVYDGNSKKISVYYLDVKNVRIFVDYQIIKKGLTSADDKIVNSVINAGDYVLKVDNSVVDTNYTLSDNRADIVYLDLKIDKAMPVVNYSSYQTYTYNGEKINPNVVINNDEQTPTFNCMLGNLVGNYCINAGSYNVTVTYNESENYKHYQSASIVVRVLRYIVNVAPRDFSFYYGEDFVAKEEININGEDIVVEYSTNANMYSHVGSYDITGATFRNSYGIANHPNYEPSINLVETKGKVHIVKRPMSIVFYNYTDLIYNGKERSIGVYGVDEINKQVVNLEFEKECDEGIIKDAKTYHLRVHYKSDIYEANNSNLLVFNIGKATYDMSNINFESKEYTLDFKEHSISIDGEIPEGVTVNYTIDGKEGNSTKKAFSHKVVATFTVDENNYFPIESMEATMRINTAWVFITIVCVLVVAGIAFVLVWMYLEYRRTHPRKIKLKIKNLVNEDLEAKRVATSVKEVLGDEEIESEHVENEDDIIEEGFTRQNFIDRIYAADSDLKYYYSEVKNELLSYEGITHSVDRKYEVFYHGTRQVAKISICNKVLRLYVNLDPDKYDKKQYNHRDMSKIDVHSRTPLRIDVNTTESLRHAKVFIRILRKKENLKTVSSFVRIDYEKFYTLKENIFAKSFKKMFSSNKNKGKNK